MRTPNPPALPLPATLSRSDAGLLTDLYRRGTPENTLRAWERDLAYISAWKRAAFAAPLAWPEAEEVALRFVLDHSVDLSDTDGEARAVAEALIGAGLRRTLACPAPARERQPKSQNPITRQVLEAMLATCDGSHRGMRDRAVLMLGWASGGRRRSEIAGLNVDDIDAGEFTEKGLIRIRLLLTKTTGPDRAPRLPLKGRAARAVMGWIGLARLDNGPLFRPVSLADRPLPRRITPDGIRGIVRHRLELAGYPPDFASAHGLRSGFLTQTARDGAPIAAAMQLSLHRSVHQAQSYYADVEIEDNPATDLLED